MWRGEIRVIQRECLVSEFVGKRPPQCDNMGEFKLIDESLVKKVGVSDEELDKAINNAIEKRLSELIDTSEDEEDVDDEIDVEAYIDELVSKRVNDILEERKPKKREIEPAGKSGMTPVKESIINQLKAFGFDDPEKAYDDYFKN